jgi:dihydroorotase
MSVLIRQATVIQPDSPYHGQALDLVLSEGNISKADGAQEENGFEKVIAAENGETLYLSSGFVDLFADYREPGYEQKETIQTGLDTAAAGGFSDVLLLPNTNPVTDNRSGVQYALAQSRGHQVTLHPMGAVSRGIEGKSLAEMLDMRAHGAVAFTDGWKPIQNSSLMMKALEYVKAFRGIVLQMPLDNTLAAGGLMHEGIVSTQLGMPGIPALAESLMVHRDIELLRYTGSRLHLTGISSAESVALIRKAKADGLDLSCSVTPYHLLLDDEILRSYDSAYKVTPPIRTEADRQALIAALADGTIDCIASHHRPQDWDAKAKEFEYSGEGMAVQHLVLPLVLEAVQDKVSMERVIDALTTAPRRIFGLPAATSFTVFTKGGKHPAAGSPSLSRNNPFEGRKLQGRILHSV